VLDPYRSHRVETAQFREVATWSHVRRQWRWVVVADPVTMAGWADTKGVALVKINEAKVRLNLA
jgi:hypothetical protein